MIKKLNVLFLSKYIIFLLLIITFMPARVSLAAEKFVGEGTESNPYLITTADQLNLLGGLVNAGDTSYNNKYYRLENDIDLSGNENFSPIGMSASYPFNGTFDGNGHKIRNITIKYTNSTTTTKNFGLFGYNNGTIKAILSVDGVISIDGTSVSVNTGGIVGYNNGLLSYCNSNVSIISVYNAGGIAGYNSGTISNSVNYGKVRSTSNSGAGGITGYNFSKITNCHNEGTISGLNSGGISGTDIGGEFNNSYNTGMVSGGDSGGIVGASYSGKIYDCYNIGSISGSDSSGGIAGSIKSSGAISTCYNIGIVSGNISGGIVGSSEGKVSDSYYIDIIKQGIGIGGGSTVAFNINEMKRDIFVNFNFNDIWNIPAESNYPLPQIRTMPMIDITENVLDFSGGKGTFYAPFVINTKVQLNNVRKNPGAFYKLGNDIVFNESDFLSAGQFYNDGCGWNPIDNFMGVFDGNNYKIIGMRIWKVNTLSGGTGNLGLFGTNKGVIKNIKVLDGRIELSEKTKPSVGLIAGYNYYGTIQNCSVDGIISGVISGAGGITSSNFHGVIEYCNNNANIKSSSHGSVISGGIAGSNSGKISYSSNNGNISGYDVSGGISGSNWSGTIIASYNTGNVTTNNSYSEVGGITGQLSNGTIRDCFNTGRVVANLWGSNSGGIAGTGDTGIIKNSYNIGQVYDAGISGTAPVVLENCYYSNDASKGVGSGVDTATACTLEQLQQQSTFKGFNFTDIWKVNPESSYKYPQLLSVPMMFYTLKYDTQDGSIISTINVLPNSKIIEPTAPFRLGYTFGGWYKEAECMNSWDFDFDTVSANTILYAKWISNGSNIYDINNDGSVNILDLALVAKSYNTVNTDINWNSNIDFNNDGIVDIFDLVACSKRIVI